MRHLALAALVSLSLAAGCASSGTASKASAAAPQQSLYERLGGKDAIVAVVDDFVGNIAKDNRINARFANSDIPHLKLMLSDQICAATGGPCKYTGKDMKTSHVGMKITDEEFTALVEDLKLSLVKFKVPVATQNDLVGALAGMKPDIVGQ